MQEVAVQWVWRIVATLAIAAVYRIWRLDTSTPAAPGIGSRLQEEWKPQQEELTAAQKHSALLDRLEEQAKNKDILYDTIEDDEDEMLIHEEEAPAEPTAPPEELDELTAQDSTQDPSPSQIGTSHQSQE
jgi:hypothetical protein